MGDMRKIPKEEWKKKLTPEQYAVMFEKGTEPKFSSHFEKNKKGMYVCAACGNELFSSDAMFDLDPTDWNYGWPSFSEPMNREHIELIEDTSHGMHRTEVVCKNCGAHLGHLFDDGPKEKGGNHFCVNGCSLKFMPMDK